MTDLKEKLKQVSELIQPIAEDNTVPRNIRSILNHAGEKLLDEKGDISVNITTAIYALDDISNDINMPPHTRTEIWGIISELEKIKEEKLNTEKKVI